WGYHDGQMYYAARDTSKLRDGKPFMEVDPTLDPNNGIVEGYLMPRFVGNGSKPVLRVDIYLDQDFREAVNFTHVLVGQNQPAYGRLMNYSYTEVADGVYMDTIRDRKTSRFLPGVGPIVGNVFVGEVQKAEDPLLREGTAFFLR
ncbi:MAG: hypothetical protein SVU32_00200, partial [Candidatus Nanohaloarchaea archaeon]|nr:hypothetical protein [Candidatus Nanohaloarchaea archaeon]